MTEPLLATKLHLPGPRAEAVARPRLIARLDAGLPRGLTLLSAPAGFGKSTLLAEWLAAADRPAAWLSLDEGDRDPARFLSYLVAALRSLIPAAEAEGVAAPPTEAALAPLLNALHDVDEVRVLVLDDYHRIDAPEVDRLLAFLVDYRPPGLHLAIATREDPPLPLARLRARDALTDLREADLRFTPDETQAFFAGDRGAELSFADVAALDARTEGWAAGLQLAALSLRGRGGADALLDGFTGSHRLVVDYLVEEVLAGQPADVQDFLSRTSVLERLNAELCDALLDARPGVGRERLAYLERANLMLTPLDDARRWYRYHHLFAEVLRTRLAQRRPDEVPALHRRAAAWFEAAGLPDEAVGHAIAGGDTERAADLIERSWRTLHDHHRYETALRWLESLPDGLVRARPGLAVAAGWSVLMLGRIEEVEPWLAAAEGAIAAPDDADAGPLRAAIAAARAYLAQALGDLEGTLRHAREVLDGPGADDPAWSSAASTLIGLAEWTGGDLIAAERTLAASCDALVARDRPLDAVGVTFVLAEVRTALGRLRDAAAAYGRALRLVERLEGGSTPDVADLHRGFAELLIERGEPDAAERHLAAARDRASAVVLPDWRHRLARTEARLAWSRGDLEGALARFEEGERHQVRTALPDVQPIQAWRARALTALGRWGDAAAWAHARGLSPDDALGYSAEFEQLTLARTLLAQHRVEGSAEALAGATGLLERLVAAAVEGGRIGSAIEARALLALAQRASGDTEAAVATLTSALNAAEPEGFVRLFLDEGAPMEDLLAAVAERGALPIYVGALRAGFAPAAGAVAPPPGATAGATLVEPLTERELDVLRLIADGRSNREIAERLQLTLNTVKSYNKNLFGKLLVERRTEAVARARDLGLL